MQTTTFGSNIEAQVCAFLELNSLRCVTRNYRCRLGEIDLVMFDEDSQTLVFVEVRFRAAALFGSATETVDWAKQRKLKRAVLHYLQKHSDARQRARIDVIGVSRNTNKTTALNVDSIIKLSTHTDVKSDYTLGVNSDGVSTHIYNEYVLRWTRNAIEE